MVPVASRQGIKGNTVFMKEGEIREPHGPRSNERAVRSALAEVGYLVARHAYKNLRGGPIEVTFFVEKPECSTDFPEVVVRAVIKEV